MGFILFQKGWYKSFIIKILVRVNNKILNKIFNNLFIDSITEQYIILAEKSGK